MIAILSARIPCDTDAEKLQACAKECFPHEGNLKYIAKLCEGKSTEGVKESLFALVTLHRATALIPGIIDTSRLILARTDSGKPYFKDSEISFSISHSRGWVVCAVAEGEEVGVDIEASAPAPEKAIKLARRFFTDRDIALVEAEPSIFSRIWSEKESESKFYGKELSIMLKEQKSHQNNQDFDKIAPKPQIHRFGCDNYPISLCTKRNDSTIIFVSEQ